MSYKDPEIRHLAREIVIKIHNMTLYELPKFGMYEKGSQIRKSSENVKSTIAEGFGRRNYQQYYLRFFILCSEFKQGNN